MKYVFSFILIFSFMNCNLFTKNQINKYSNLNNVSVDTLTLLDTHRNRLIPVAFYTSIYPNKKSLDIVIFSHGYGQNNGSSYLNYSYLTENLARNSYFVVSIQHELPTDDLLPSSGIPQVVRRPFWERGVENILFIINYLKNIKKYNLNFKNIILIGHSNGGDMTALFPQKYPNIVKKIITLDHRRMALGRAISPQILTLRSNDQAADEGVLPTELEQKKMNITIIKLANTPHNDMDNHATPLQRHEINQYILNFLNKSNE